jgi:hypothetical protein
MITSTIRSLFSAAAMLATLCFTSSARAQCCGAGTTAFYQPAAYTAYSPVAYTTYNTGWYPGYFLDRIRTRLWGAPSTYVAAYPSTYAAAYPSTYVASYPTYAASYSPCSTCVAAPQVTLRPVCTTCCDPCASCSSCSSGAAYGVSQTSYQESSGCACGAGGQSGGTTIVVPNNAMLAPGSQQLVPSNGGQQPQLPETFETTPRSSEKPASGDTLEPEPAGTNGSTPGDAAGGSGAYLEAPQLFSPSDRAARREIASVKMALYEQPVGHQRVSARSLTITTQQAERDAAGWQSASK